MGPSFLIFPMGAVPLPQAAIKKKEHSTRGFCSESVA